MPPARATSIQLIHVLRKNKLPFRHILFSLAFVSASALLYMHGIAPRAAAIRYAAPALLNIPSFANVSVHPDGRDVLALSREHAIRFPRSLVAHYNDEAQDRYCARLPYLPHLRAAVERISHLPRFNHLRLVASNETFTVVVDVAEPSPHNGSSLTMDFVRALVVRSKTFDNVVILALGTHGERTDVVRRDVRMLIAAVKQGGVPAVQELRPVGTDSYIALMHQASHLLVHRGAFSALGAVVCRGVVFYTPEFAPYMERNEYRWLLNNAQTAELRPPLRWQESINMMGAVRPTCCLFEAFGYGDGEKIICSNAKKFKQKDGCWVVSLGCNGHWEFETDIIKRTACKVHTFDCTGTWDVPKELEGRVQLHKLCIGEKSNKREDFIGWEKVVQIGRQGLPAAVKMDIEGFEFPVLKEVLEGPEHMLPEQLAVEIHAGKGTKEMIQGLFLNLSRRGFHLIHRADNPYCPSCSEVTILREHGMPDKQ